MRRVCSCNPVWVRCVLPRGHGVGALCRPTLCLRLPVARHGEYRPEWPPSVVDHVGPGYEPCVRPADALRAEGYPDDPAIVDNPYQVGLFLGAPQLRGNTRSLFPPAAPGPPAVALGVPASSTGSANPFPFSSGVRDWKQITTRLTADPGARAGEDQQDGGGGSSRARAGEASGREYPAEPQVVHRGGPTRVRDTHTEAR